MAKRSDSIGNEKLRLFHSLFVAREDAYAKKSNDSGQPIAVRESLDGGVVTAHLMGDCRVATYLLVRESRTPFLVFDLDELSQKLVKRILKRLRRYKVHAYLEASKSRGFHIWVFFDKPAKAAGVREFANLILRGLEGRKIEIFPKQDEIADGHLGNCIFLPLFGADTGEGRTVFLNEDFVPHRNQWKFLESIRRTQRRLITNACRNVKSGIAQVRKPAEAMAGPITKGKRNVTLTSMAGTMRECGFSVEAIEAAVLTENELRCSPPLPEKEVKSIAASIGSYEPGSMTKDGRDSQATKLVGLASNLQLFHTADMEVFASCEVDDHSETWRLRDAICKRWLASLYYQTFGKAPSSQSVANALDVLEGRAIHEGTEREVFVRIARHESAVYLDLADPSWRAVEVTADGWRIVPKPPVKFRRARGMMPLPVPEPGGRITELRPFLNVASDDDFVLVISHLVAAFRPEGPYPLLVLQGEQGTAKTTVARVLRELVDPSSTPVRSEPREVRDLMIAARNSWCTVFDNISRLPQWLSDSLCRLSTGGGFSTRELYSDDQEKLFEAKRPIILNGIDGVAIRGDLVDRAILMYLPVIPREERKPERRFWRDFRDVQPRILGALLDALSCALRLLPTVNLQSQPRMADFAEWVTAAEPALGWRSGAFMVAYESNRSSANTLTLEASPIVAPLRRLCARGNWEGTAATLLHELSKHTNDRNVQPRDWPKAPWHLSLHLRRIAPNLRAAGLDVHFDEKTPGSGSKRLIKITRVIQRYPRTVQRYPRTIRRYPRSTPNAA